jgi:hypothetical protein
MSPVQAMQRARCYELKPFCAALPQMEPVLAMTKTFV